jgi:zinc and cadmium transporter
MLAGFVVMFFVQRFLHFHHHDVPEESPEIAGRHRHESIAQSQAEERASGEHHAVGHWTLAEQSAHHLSWAGAATGLTLHTLIDGVALAASVQAEQMGAALPSIAGLGTFLVIIMHKPFDAMMIGTLMAKGGWSRTARHCVNALFALVIPVGVALFYLGVTAYSDASSAFLGAALAFAGGTFLCIAASDLLPELQFHAHDRLKLSGALVAGLALAIVVGRFEHHGHNTEPAHENHVEPAPASPTQ